MFTAANSTKRLYFIHSLFTAFVAFLLMPLSASAQNCAAPNTVTGKAFFDYNLDGLIGANEGGVEGVVVNVVGANGLIGSATTDKDGIYSIATPDGQRVRVEIDLAHRASGPVGQDANTSVVFVDNGPSCVNFSFTSPKDFCPNNNGNPDVAIPCYTNGDALAGNINNPAHAAAVDSYVKMPYDREGYHIDIGTGSTALPPEHLAYTAQTGPTWGNGYRRGENALYTSALMKRHSGLGPGGLDAIYRIDLSVNPPAITEFINLEDFGISAGSIGPRGLPILKLEDNLDLEAYSLAGVAGFGDLDISEDDSRMYVTNLHLRELIEIRFPAGGGAVTAADITRHTLPLSDCPSNDLLPWGIDTHDGSIYVGAVCDAATTRDRNELEARIYKMIGASSFQLVTSFGLADLNRGYNILNLGVIPEASLNNARWQPRPTDFFNHVLGGVNPPQQTTFIGGDTWPILSDLEVLPNGNFALAFMDGTGLQHGSFNRMPIDPSIQPTTLANHPSAGQLYNLCNLGGGNYQLEVNASCPGQTQGVGADTMFGPSFIDAQQRTRAGEFFHSIFHFLPPLLFTNPEVGNQFEIGIHAHTFTGGLAHFAGSGQLYGTVYDPIDGRVEANGVRTFALTDGDVVRSYEVSREIFTGKQTGLGDPVLLCDPAPIEIGNRVWLDQDMDGIQDPDEDGIAGVVVSLYDCQGNLLATQTTDAAGNYRFTQAQHDLAPNSCYEVRTDDPSNTTVGGPLADLLPSISNSGQNDTIDCDAVEINGVRKIVVNTGSFGRNDHSFDFCFAPSAGLAVSITEGCALLSEQEQNSIQVTLLANEGQFQGSRVQNLNNGVATFATVPTGEYTVRVQAPAGFTSKDKIINVTNTGTITPVSIALDVETGFNIPINTVWGGSSTGQHQTVWVTNSSPTESCLTNYTVYSQNGNVDAANAIIVPPLTTIDFIPDSEIANTWIGTIEIDAPDCDSITVGGLEIVCQPTALLFEHVLVDTPQQCPRKGETYLLYNDFDPTNAGNVATNWLTIRSRSASETQSFLVEVFAQTGGNSPIAQQTVTVPARGRRDISIDGVAGPSVGVVKVTQLNGFAGYEAELNRYVEATTIASRRTLAALRTLAKTGESVQYLPTETGADTDTYIEVVATQAGPVTLVFRSDAGKLLGSITQSFQQNEVRHYASLLAPGESGWVEVTGSGVVAFATSYTYSGPGGELISADGVHGQTDLPDTQRGKINTFNGNRNWGVFKNTTNTTKVLTIDLIVNGVSIGQQTVVLGPANGLGTEPPGKTILLHAQGAQTVFNTNDNETGEAVITGASGVLSIIKIHKPADDLITRVLQ